MKISGINNAYHYTNEVNKRQQKNVSPEVAQGKDKLEISEKAKIMNSQQVEKAKDVDTIKERLSSGFYNSDEVISRVADAILKEFDS